MNKIVEKTNDAVDEIKGHLFHDGATSKPSEGISTRAIEQQTAKIPSLGYLSLAVGSMIASATLVAMKKEKLGNFIGLWAPSLLTIGLYNKLVKIENEMGLVNGG